ncbi:alpha/beta hydrolase [Streptomyces albulus]|nr:alpha/beta hydrolase [Streptomyces noursei]
MEPLFFPHNPSFWFETLRSFGHIAYGGADFGEVVVTTQRITAGDYDSWHDEWLATADRVADEGRTALAGGHRVSARDAFLRASNYYRSAEFFLHGDATDPRILHAYDASVRCFRQAAALFTPVIEPVEIPYEDTVLPGYLYRADDSGTARPTVVMFNGFDGTAEEMHFGGAAAAVERGYNVLSFDGPGQPGTRHHHGLVFRPDWENAVGPVLDYALTRPEVDPARIALLGNSMGGPARATRRGLRAPPRRRHRPRRRLRSGRHGHRLPALDRAEAERRLRADRDPELDAAVEAAMAASPKIRWLVDQGMYVMGADTPRGLFATFLDYHLRDGIAQKITCPTLVCSAPDDVFFEGQPELLHEHLTCPKTLLEFTAVLGADAHCQAGAQRLAFARVYDWLDDVMAESA